ncbi:MAG: hypothetical protein OEZ14_07850 [Acidimicrobiia bacterium]|nr:hypothetical protein [Acidimicrobiia bacterium]
MAAAVLVVEDDHLIASSLVCAPKANGYEAAPATASRKRSNGLTPRHPASCHSISALPTTTVPSWLGAWRPTARRYPSSC